MSKDISVIIIAVNKEPRNSQLFKELISMNIFRSVHILAATTADQLDLDYLYKQQSMAQDLLGRKVTPEEISVKDSHAEAHSLAISLKCEEVLILEDDTEIIDESNFLITINTRRDPNLIEINSLYSPKWAIWIKSKNRIRALYPPPAAVAYLTNRKTLLLIEKKESIGLADWPIWSRHIEFYLYQFSGLGHPSNNSFLEGSRQISKQNKAPRGLLSVFLVSKYRKDNLYYRVFIPSTWKLFKFLEKKLNSQNSNTESSIILCNHFRAKL